MRIPHGRRLAGIAACLLFALGAGRVRADEEPPPTEDTQGEVEKLKEEVQKLKDDLAAQKESTDAVKQKQDAQNPTVRAYDGLLIEDPRGIWAVRFNGRVQGDFRTYSPNDIIADTFSLRRARMAVGLTAWKDYQMYVEGEFATGTATGTTTQSASLTNAWLELGWFQFAKIRMGQFKPLFGLENSAPDVLTDFQERGLPQNLIQNLNYDRGVMVHGSPFRGIYYGATVSNGSGLNLEESQGNRQEAETDGKDITVRATANVTEMLKGHDSIFHLGGSWKDGAVISRGGTAFTPATGRTEAFGMTFFASAPLTNGQIDRRLTAAEALASIKQWKLQSEWWQARYAGEAPVNYDRSIDSYYVSAGWLITGEMYADSYRNGVFGRIKPRNTFGLDTDAGWGAWEAMVRYSVFDASEFTATNPVGTGVLVAGSANKARAVTAQVKWMPNPVVRLLVDYIVTDFGAPVTQNTVTTSDERAWTFRAQMDF